MDMDQAAVFLAGSILTVLGFLVILVGIVIANNIIHKYWKPFGWTFMPTWTQEPHRFASQEEIDRIAPKFDESNTKDKSSK